MNSLVTTKKDSAEHSNRSWSLLLWIKCHNTIVLDILWCHHVDWNCWVMGLSMFSEAIIILNCDHQCTLALGLMKSLQGVPAWDWPFTFIKLGWTDDWVMTCMYCNACNHGYDFIHSWYQELNIIFLHVFVCLSYLRCKTVDSKEGVWKTLFNKESTF